jgi:hypothetical protein
MIIDNVTLKAITPSLTPVRESDLPSYFEIQTTNVTSVPVTTIAE